MNRGQVPNGHRRRLFVATRNIVFMHKRRKLATYKGKCGVCKFLRQLEIRSESWLNYVYNPF